MTIEGFNELPTTPLGAVRYFSDTDRAFAFVVRMRLAYG
jgi:hypothetical protein